MGHPVGIGVLSTHSGDWPPSLARSWPRTVLVVIEDGPDEVSRVAIGGSARAELVVCGRPFCTPVASRRWHGAALPVGSGLLASGAVGGWIHCPSVEAVWKGAAGLDSLVVVFLPRVARAGRGDLPHTAHDVVG